MKNLTLLERLREALVDVPNIEEKKMFGGITFMIDDKMCIGVNHETELLCRIDPLEHEKVLEKVGCREMIHNGKVMKGYLFVSEEGYQSPKDFDYWVQKCLTYNPQAKSSKKKK
jgi:TfoX/Sxy family transcriptional regulator of competence genes